MSHVSIHAPKGANLEEVIPLPNPLYSPEAGDFKPARNLDETITDYADRLRKIIDHLDAGETDIADMLLDDMARRRDTSLFQELGKLTRDFHEALQVFRTDNRVASFTEVEFHDARERLKYVISMTNQAADRSLTAAENSLPIAHQLRHDATTLRAAWERFNRREMAVQEFRQINREMLAFFRQVEEIGPQLESNLTEVIMAQDFQDLTGQIIKKVITLVDDVEQNLVNLVKISGERLLDNKDQKKRDERSYEAQGALVPGVDDTHVEVVSGQDAVDDLLSSLGF